MQLDYLLVVIVVSDVKVMSSVAVIFAVINYIFASIRVFSTSTGMIYE